MCSGIFDDVDTEVDAASDEKSTTSKFRLDIQGLRALAVTLVILCHASVPHFAGGYVGVDVFFVISGFVITGLLTRSPTRGIVSNLTIFYARRIRRILPASTLVLIATVAASYYWLGSYAGQRLVPDVRWASLFAVNFHFIAVGTDYFTKNQPPSLVLQYWSLALEEQFYIFFPALLFGIIGFTAGRRHRMYLLSALGAVVIVSAWWSVVETPHNPVDAYFSPFTRFWELGLGGLIALLPPTWQLRNRAASAAIGWFGLGAVIVAAVLLNAQSAYPGWLAWWPCAGAAAILWVGRENTPFGPTMALSLRPFIYVGAISYSLYLWHFAWLNIPLQYATTAMSPTSRILQIAGASICAVISYHFIENPFRRSRWITEHKWSAFALGIILIASIWVVTAAYLSFNQVV